MTAFHKITLEETGLYSSIYLDYVTGSSSLKPFYPYTPESSSFASAIEDIQFNDDVRKDLVADLHRQYQSSGIEDYPKEQIDLLSDSNTFTITTGHQLNIFTGPMFFIYKLVSTINLCKRLKEAHPDHNFVPIYWMASEDHDFEEINHIHLFGKYFEWQTEQSGAVGRFDSGEVANLLSDLNDIPAAFIEAYRSSGNLSQATRKLVHHLFKDQGLVILDSDSPVLKQHLSKVVAGELEENVSYKAVSATNEQLSELGYKIQVNPREINLFELGDGKRERITDASFTAAPEVFSPNVVTRPIYQQIILPNLAYIGGPGELAYWLQLKSAFEAYDVFYPVLMPRNAALNFSQKGYDKFYEFGFELKDLFRDGEQLKKEYLDTVRSVSTEDEGLEILKQFDAIKTKLTELDKSLEGFAEKEKSLLEKQLGRLSGKLTKVEKQKHEAALAKIDKLKEVYFPGGAPQERVHNILNVIINKPDFIQTLLDEFDPFDLRYNVIVS